MAEPLTPVDVERLMSSAIGDIKGRTETVRKSRDDFAAAKRAHTIRLAAHRQDPDNKGSRADREDKALLANQPSWVALDTAEVSMKYAQDLLDVSEKELSALQTVAKLVLQAYNVNK